MQEADTHGSTIFVSNLPYTATSTDVQTLFSDIAPVRSAFVVLDKETKASKGVAYVSFAIKEDAEMAMGGDKPLELDGRVLGLQWADRKGTSTHVKKDKPPKPKKVARPKVPSDPDAVRTLVLANLPVGIDSKALWKKARKVPGATEVVYPVPERDEHTAFVKFATAAQASAAVAKLHNHVFKGSRISAVIKKRVDGLVAGRKTGAPSHSSRLIIRNLPWDATEEDIHRLFAPYGPIYSVTLPTAKSTDDTKTSSDRHRGFAFVWMLAHADAERAIKGVNGRVVGAKGKKKKTRKEREEIAREKAAKRLRRMRGEEGEGEEEEGEGEEEGDVKEGEEKEGRIIAVDWALSKDKWEEAVSQRQGKEVMEVDREEGEEGKEQPDGSEDEVEGGGESEDEQGSSVDEESEAEGGSEEGSESHERPQLPNTDVGTTLFVRNVPFEATEDDLRTLFRAFGPLRYARITLDQETGRSRGTGFVCFWKREDADSAIEEAEAMAKELGTNPTTAKPHNPFSMSLLTPDPSASLVKRLVLHGRTLSIARAVAREEADRLKEEGERSREKQDKRNLYLMREGVIFPNSPAAAQLSATELATRQASFDSRRALLRSNPSLYVSRTRISVRRVPLWVSERVLKRLAMYAAREFEDEVKRGEREGLTRDELLPIEQEGEAKDGGKKGKKGRSTGVRQAKIVRAADRMDAVSGKGRSRGYGFIETEEHADALRILRWVNNRPGVVGSMRGWWKEELNDLLGALEKGEGKEEDRTRVKRLKDELERLEAEPDNKESNKTLILEFAIENIQVVKRRKERSGASSGPHKPEGNRKRKAPEQEEDPAAAAPRKRRRDSERPTKEVVPPKTAKTVKSPAKAGVKSGSEDNIGGIIGRKRRERRKGK
ncbi:RNA recognition motif-containing protein [Ceratobasidium sp. 414]|nr:RNA recognition motif-containing protein [Ceratobasidium sp. 414]